MKIRNIFIFTALILVIFCFGACGSWDDSDNQGSIIINFDNSGGRYAIADDDIAKMAYKVTLTRTGREAAITRETEIGAKSISISVPEGTWNIDVKAEGEGKRVGKGAGKIANVTVTAGRLESVNIEMFATSTRVSNWDELKEDFNELNKADGKLRNLEEIEIISTELKAGDLKMANAPTLKIEKTITLWSKTNTTIIRSDNIDTDATVFTIEKGTLILESRNGGSITINGNKSLVRNCERALINVMANGILIMRKEVILTNNHTAHFGGGVYVEDGKFFMEGGTISGNTAEESGGGVYVDGRSSSKKTGEFKKTGGIIYGSNAGDADKNKSNRKNNGDGDAVYDRVTPRNDTLGANAPWPSR